MIDTQKFEVISDSELLEVDGGGVAQYIIDGIGVGSALTGGSPQGAILGGVIGWALYPSAHVS